MPPRIEIQVHRDTDVLPFAARVALLSGLVFGWRPRNAFGSGPASSLRESGRCETKLGRIFETVWWSHRWLCR